MGVLALYRSMDKSHVLKGVDRVPWTLSAQYILNGITIFEDIDFRPSI